MADTDIVQVIAEARIDARSLSEFVFKPADFMVTRRLAPPINTLEYYLNHFRNVEAEGSSVVARANNIISATQASANTAINNIIIDGNAQISNAISNAGFVQVGTFAAGATLAKRNDAIQASDGKLYRWGGSLPKTVAASSTPASSGGFGADAWVEVSDASLAQKLSGLGGASLIKDGVSVFNNLAEFNASASKVQKNSKVYLRQIYQNNDLEGQGRVYSFVTNEIANAVNIATTGGFLTRPYDGKVFVAEFGCKPDDNTLLIYSTNSTALQKAFDLIRYYDGGVLSMGNKCKYPIGSDKDDVTQGDTVYANVSNLKWRFNYSVIDMRLFRLAWHPTATEYGNHKNITITNAIYNGDSSVKRQDGVVLGGCQQDFVHVDGLVVTGCKFIEAHAGGHIFDLMGCRHVTIEGNEFLGSAITDRYYTEAVQVGHSVSNSAGNPIKYGGIALFADLPTTHVYYKNNTCKPYINPTSGETTYPARPIGHHGFNGGSDIYVTDNIFDNIQLLDYVYPYYGYILQLSGVNNIVVEDNVILCSNGNNKIVRFDTYNSGGEAGGYKPYFSISNNIVTIKDPIALTEHGGAKETAFNPFYIRVLKTSAGDTQGVCFKFNGNNINYDNTNNTAKLETLLFIEYQNNYPEFYICSNSIKIKGNADSFISSSAYSNERLGGFIDISDNIIDFVGNNRAILLPENLYTENNKGTTLKITANTFYSTWIPIDVASRAPVIIKDNLFIKPSLTAQDGVATSTFGFILVKKGQPVVLDGNIVVNPDPDNPLLKIGSSAITPDVSDIRPVNS